jgi:hypothetical protein
MPNDATLKSVFDLAKQGPSGGEFPSLPVVFATFVEHFSNSHPASNKDSADLVTYSNGQLRLSADKKTLSGEFKLWRNIFKSDQTGPPDAFADPRTELTILLSVSQSGQASYQKKLKGKPIGGVPPLPLAASYENGLFVEKSQSGVRSLSFTLGTTT